jgi:hypothetical protein
MAASRSAVKIRNLDFIMHSPSKAFLPIIPDEERLSTKRRRIRAEICELESRRPNKVEGPGARGVLAGPAPHRDGGATGPERGDRVARPS